MSELSRFLPLDRTKQKDYDECRTGLRQYSSREYEND